MKITRRQLRQIILEVYKPGSPADLYDRYGMTGEEQEFIGNLTKSDDPDYREQGRELAWDAYEMPIAETPSLKLIMQMKDVVENMNSEAKTRGW